MLSSDPLGTRKDTSEDTFLKRIVYTGSSPDSFSARIYIDALMFLLIPTSPTYEMFIVLIWDDHFYSLGFIGGFLI